MYTREQYAQAMGFFHDLSPEDQAKVAPKLDEFRVSHNRGASAGPLPSLEGDTVTEPTPSVPVDVDESLPSASKKKSIHAPPEYVAKNKLANVAHAVLATIKDPIDGPMKGMYFEPSEKKFQEEMQPVLKARGVEPGTDDYKDQFDQYKDRLWKQAYDKAVAEDSPLTRVDYAGDSSAWSKFGRYLAEAPDIAGTFAKGYAKGFTGHATSAASAVSDAALGNDEVGRDAEQANRNPLSAVAGEFAGALNPRSVMSKVAGGVSGAVKALPGMAGWLGSAAAGAAGGVAAGGSDLAGRSLSQGAGDVVHGRGTGNARDMFTQNLLGTGLVGGGLGAAGGLIGKGAELFQKGTVRAFPELGPFREGGGETSVLSGAKAPEAVLANEEAARFAIPGETKARPVGNAVEIAAKAVQEPLSARNALEQKAYRAQAAAENEQAIASDRTLLVPKPMRNTMRAIVDLVQKRSLPDAPGAIPTAEQAIGGRNNQPFIDLLGKIGKPSLVLSSEAGAKARATGGVVLSVKQAKGLGLSLKGLKATLPVDAEGVPLDAPALIEDPGHWNAEGAPVDAEGAPLPVEETPAPKKKPVHKVLLEPRQFDAQKMEEQISAFDDAAKAGRVGAHVDPAYEDLQRHIREDRKGFSPGWAELKDKHYRALLSLEQRSGHANLRGENPYSEMDANGQKAFDSALVNHGTVGATGNTSEALRSLAKGAGVDDKLATLGAQTSYSALKGRSQLKLNDAVGPGLDATAHLKGILPFLHLRADALARGLGEGPTDGAVARGASRFLPGMGLNGGALGQKSSAMYNSIMNRLTPEQRRQLQLRLDASEPK